MKVSLPGVLEKAAAIVEATDTTGLGFQLRELLEHLRLVRANPDRIGEFLESWVDSESERSAT